MSAPWDYLVVTASNAAQALAYRSQLAMRRVDGVACALVVADLDGRRIGSGGSTLQCLIEILNRERARTGVDLGAPGAIERTLAALRILIVHAGGDSRRLPAYSSCGKIFVPLPGHAVGDVPLTLFDRLVPAFLALPGATGQTLVTAGDALTHFASTDVRFDAPGLTALGCYATPEEAARHGVFVAGADTRVSLYLQKPSVDDQRARGAITERGTALDIGVMSWDAATSATLLEAFGVELAADGALQFTAETRARLLAWGVDLYREICCALGDDAAVDLYLKSTHESGTAWPIDERIALFGRLRRIPLHMELVGDCRFLHFGTSRQLIDSGVELLTLDEGRAPASRLLLVNNDIDDSCAIRAGAAWVEGCRIRARLDLEGDNLLAGVDVDAPLRLGVGACLDVVAGGDGWFVRCYAITDTFKQPLGAGATLCGHELGAWLRAVELTHDDVWPETDEPRTLWNARVFVSTPARDGYRDLLWMYAPESATAEQRAAYRAAPRYSAADIAVRADQAAFHQRRAELARQSLK